MNQIMILIIVQAILFLWSLQHSIEFNCFLSLESNTISFYSVTFHSTFQHFHRYTTGFCPWSSSLFVVHNFSFYTVNSSQRLRFHIIYMLMTRKFTFHFHPISLMTVSPCFPPPLTRFMPGSLPIAFQSIHQRLNSS